MSKEKKLKEQLKYIVSCCKNITQNKNMNEMFGLIPPMLELYKIQHETEVFLNRLEKRK